MVSEGDAGVTALLAAECVPLLPALSLLDDAAAAACPASTATGASLAAGLLSGSLASPGLLLTTALPAPALELTSALWVLLTAALSSALSLGLLLTTALPAPALPAPALALAPALMTPLDTVLPAPALVLGLPSER